MVFKKSKWDPSAKDDEVTDRETRRDRMRRRSKLLTSIASLMVVVFFLAVLVAFPIVRWYIKGRAVGAGVRDALEQPVGR